MKRLLLISRCPPTPLHLGDRLILYHLARELNARGYVLDLLAFANRPEDWQADWADAPFFNNMRLFLEPARGTAAILARALLPARRFPTGAAGAWSPQMWQAIGEQLAQQRYDAVHLLGGVQVYEFRRALGTLPAVIVPYESYSLFLRRTRAARQGIARFDPALLLRLALARTYERFMFAPYAHVVVVSPQDREELLALNPALRVAVIPNGIDLATFVPQPVPREPATLLFVGNYEYAPNVDAAMYLVNIVLPQLLNSLTSVKMQLVGNAPPPALLALAGTRGGVQIEVTGRVPDVRPYLARASAFVCPLRMGAGIKNKVLEALAMGCPVVATPLSLDGIAALDGEQVLAASETTFASRILELLADPALQARLSSGGRRLIETQYSWARAADAYERLYAALN